MKTMVISCVSLACGGAERVISILSSKFLKQFDSVTIVTWKDAPVFYQISEKIRIVVIEKEISSSNYLKKIFWFRSFLKEQKPSIVLSFLAYSSIGVLIAHAGLKMPVIIAERNDPRYLNGGLPIILIRNFLYTFASGILEQTEQNKRYFKGIKRKKTSVIYNPIFMSSDHVGIAETVEKQNMIVSVGRLFPQKNHKMLIKAFANVYRRHPEYKLIIYGEGPCRNELENLITTLHLNQCVFLPGNKSNIFNLIKDARLFVMSSDFEGMPNALIEAMCLGLPCISTKVSGATDLISNGENGILVSIGSEEEMKNAIETIIENEALAKKISQKASRIYNELTVEKISGQWVSYVNKYL